MQQVAGPQVLEEACRQTSSPVMNPIQTKRIPLSQIVSMQESYFLTTELHTLNIQFKIKCHLTMELHYSYICVIFACITAQRSTWQSSTLVLITPFIYSFSMVGETPKLFPMQSISVLPSGYVTSTEPFKMTDQESSYKRDIAGYMENESLNIVVLHYKDTTLTIFSKEKLFFTTY